MTCPSRHWFAVGVRTGIRAPTCRRCGAPNPRITAEEQADYEEWARERSLSPQQRRWESAAIWWGAALRKHARGRLDGAEAYMGMALRKAGLPDPHRR